LIFLQISGNAMLHNGRRILFAPQWAEARAEMAARATECDRLRQELAATKAERDELRERILDMLATRRELRAATAAVEATRRRHDIARAQHAVRDPAQPLQ
jgi:hypothetical protein